MNIYKYFGALLVLALLAGPYQSRAEQMIVVGDQAPGQDYRPIIENGRPVIPVLTLSSQVGPLGLQNQILQSAAQIHRIRVVTALTVGGLPEPISPKTSPLSPHASPSTSTTSLPPDPNFSFVSLLNGSLPFVQDIQAALAQAASLAAFAASVGGALSLLYLTLRSNLLQSTLQDAWGWMVENARQGDLPLVMNYQTALGNTIDIYDTFATTATGKVFVPTDLDALKQLLDILPQSLLQNITAIVNGPVTETTGEGSITTGNVITMESGAEINAANLPHEIGATVWESSLFQDGPLGQQWGALWSQSTDPVWDTVDPWSNFPPRPMPATQPTPWGDTNEAEDFASIFNDWVNESAAPAINLNLNPPQSTSIIEQAAYAATQGHTILLQKVLLIAALFTDQATQELSLYNYQGYQSGNTIERSLNNVQSSPTSLTLGDFKFSIQDGLLTGASTLATEATLASGVVQNIPAVNYTFATPVPIPPFAANIWGIN